MTLSICQETAIQATAVARLRVMFVITSMPVGGAETLLVNLIRRLDRNQFSPEVCCLKEPGPLGEILAREIPLHHHLLQHKFDIRVLLRLTRLLRQRQVAAVVTVGAGDKMFWGRWAARRAGVPVVASALHSTGWPDGIGWLNRRLTPWTDAFIAVARTHGEYLIHTERFPADKVAVIPNGVDTHRFAPSAAGRARIRRELGLTDDVPLCGIVAALRPEKNHALFLRAAAQVLRGVPAATFLVIGDGPLRGNLEQLARELGIETRVRFLGTQHEIPPWLAALDLFALTSDNEANPVSILEAMASGVPVVATRVGSVAEMVHDGHHGRLVRAGDVNGMADAMQQVLTQPAWGRQMGAAARSHGSAHGSLERMVQGYQQLIRDIYNRKIGPKKWLGQENARTGSC